MGVPKKNISEEFQKFILRFENMILIGRFQPRERLVENDLARDMGVPRNWVRDALKILESRGLVKTVPYRGATVKDIDSQEINEIFQVRVALEKLSNRLACENFKANDGKTLKEIADRIKACYRENSFEAMVDANAHFHNYIAKLSRNETLIQMINQLKIRFHIFNTFAWSSPKIVDRLFIEHEQFISAFENNETDLLDNLAENHFSHSTDLYLIQLRARKTAFSAMGE